MNGPSALDDMAINSAMDRYFEVDKEDRLFLSKEVRRFFQVVLNTVKERNKNGNPAT
jgi:hypothetical protein